MVAGSYWTIEAVDLKYAKFAENARTIAADSPNDSFLFRTYNNEFLPVLQFDYDFIEEMKRSAGEHISHDGFRKTLMIAFATGEGSPTHELFIERPGTKSEIMMLRPKALQMPHISRTVTFEGAIVQ